MSARHRGRIGAPVTAPAGGVKLETFVPWRLVQRGVRREVITPLGAPQAFSAEAAQEREGRAQRRATRR